MPADSLPPHSNSRRNFVRAGITAGLAAMVYPAAAAGHPNNPAPTAKTDAKGFEFDEVTIDDLQRSFQAGQHTSRSVTEKYLARIAEIDKSGPLLNSIIELNPEALEIAEALDQERKSKGPRGPLHGIPILIKDNIDTGDRMNTTAGSLALLGSRAPKDAFVAGQLRKAG